MGKSLFRLTHHIGLRETISELYITSTFKILRHWIYGELSLYVVQPQLFYLM